MKQILGFILWGLTASSLWAGAGTDTNRAPALALAIVYDGSGSMADRVADLHGRQTPKFEIANNAVMAIARKVQEHCVARNVSVDAGLVLFTDGKVREALAMQSFEVKRFVDWAAVFGAPAGNTPLGDAISAADKMLARSKAWKRHILVVTDGQSNQGETPARVLTRLNKQSVKPSVYFVAFDVSAKVFEPAKKLGATVVSAANESELRTQVDHLLGQKILLEAE